MDNSMTEAPSQNIVRVLLRNEITWVVTLVTLTIGFFNMVVLPLNEMRIQLTQIQTEIANQDKQTEILRIAMSSLNTSVSVLQTQVDYLLKR